MYIKHYKKYSVYSLLYLGFCAFIQKYLYLINPNTQAYFTVIHVMLIINKIAKNIISFVEHQKKNLTAKSNQLFLILKCIQLQFYNCIFPYIKVKLEIFPTTEAGYTNRCTNTFKSLRISPMYPWFKNMGYNCT